MFRTDLLSIVRSLDTVLITIGICHTIYVDCLQRGQDENIIYPKHIKLFTKIKLRKSASI